MSENESCETEISGEEEQESHAREKRNIIDVPPKNEPSNKTDGNASSNKPNSPQKDINGDPVDEIF